MDLQNAQARLAEVEQKAKLAQQNLDDLREQSAGSAKAAEKMLRHSKKVLTRAQSFEAEVKP